MGSSVHLAPVAAQPPAPAAAGLSVFRPDDGVPESVRIAKQERHVNGWVDALEKQLAIIKEELAQQDCDEVYWKREYMAVEDALDTLQTALAPIDEVICAYRRTRGQIIAGIGVRLREKMPGTNLPEFLIRDDPQGYLRW